MFLGWKRGHKDTLGLIPICVYGTIVNINHISPLFWLVIGTPIEPYNVGNKIFFFKV